jgi:transposase
LFGLSGAFAFSVCSAVEFKDLAISLENSTVPLYIPPYSPNLNLIERLWKFVKKQCLYSKYYSEFMDFKNAISDCLNKADTTHKQELDSLLTLRFQSFEKVQSVAV